MIDLPGVSALQVVVDRLAAVRSYLFQRGDPGRVAGDPAAIRGLADAHRAGGRSLGEVVALGRDRVSRVLAGSWQGDASARFAGYWADLEGRLGSLAAAHLLTADRLEQVAGDSARLNGEVTALLGATEAWLCRAAGALAARDVVAAGWLAGEGMTLVVRWERLLRDVEVFAEGIGSRLETRLDFARRPVAMGRRAPPRQPPIHPPPELEGDGLSTRLRKPGGSLMPDRRREGPGGRRRPLPIPVEVQRRGLPRGIGEEPWLRRPGPRRRPRRPPADPSPRAGTGAGSDPRRKPGEPVLRPGGAPVTVPGVGATHPPPWWPHRHPGMGPLPTPVDAYVFQLVALGVLVVTKVKKGARLLREGRNRGGGKGNGGGTGKK